MDQNYHKLLNQISATEPPRELLSQIMTAISRRQKRRSVLILGVLTLASLVATPLSLWALWQETVGSSFYYLIAAALSDLQSFVVIWKDFSLAILEALPLGGLIASAISLTVFTSTIRFFIQHKKQIFVVPQIKLQHR